MDYRGVVFDLGGVVLGSPLEALARFEAEAGIPAGFINRQVSASGNGGAWQRLERGELKLSAFFETFENECAAAGVELSAREMMRCIEGAARPRPQMLEAIDRLREAEYRVGALTNNWERDAGETRGEEEEHELADRFHVFVESRVVGMRKPDPRIYELTCGRLGLSPGEVVFLDDIGANLKSARRLGMLTIKVTDPGVALRELGEALGLELGGRG